MHLHWDDGGDSIKGLHGDGMAVEMGVVEEWTVLFDLSCMAGCLAGMICIRLEWGMHSGLECRIAP